MNRKRGKPSQSEFTVVKVDAYNGINEHLSQTTNTTMKSVEDIVEYNNRNSGTEGPDPGDTPAFLSGQVLSPNHGMWLLIDAIRIFCEK